MDRKIYVRDRRKRQHKTIARILSVMLPLLILCLFLPRWIERTLLLKPSQLGEVDRAPIEISVRASGKLLPLSEEIIVSPFNSRILEVYKNQGETLREGEPLLKLERASVESGYCQKLDEKQMKESKAVQARIALENSLSELRMQQQLKEMQLFSSSGAVSRERNPWTASGQGIGLNVRARGTGQSWLILRFGFGARLYRFHDSVPGFCPGISVAEHKTPGRL